MAADNNEIDVLLVEDNANEAELTKRALRLSVRDGYELLERGRG